ncbi:DUF3089 domain-containing protein [Sphingomicrobium sediminis]|uniref:DUF3089 domain-containing protein n=1 Tax=Sphingomicrobium sediminis TaxID=2950949 RepID=A0A9X2EN16_9SPHN|nr:DUF3089 domain-containing protein [Sphingomicrobium sediminis]MCM8558424.1 DUF3089 domain-containing protein [Sphingomicrobium sediminis]
MSLLALASLAAAQPALDAPDYTLSQNWICLPGGDDICSDIPIGSELTPQGWGRAAISAPYEEASVDCFYVYPTISGDSGMNSDMQVGSNEELRITQMQFARFSSVCRPFAPVYRQMTMASIALAATGADMTRYGEIAYSDVRDAFRTYLRDHNDGRPFVLIGHSQGSIMLEQLVREEIEGSDAHDLMLRAILPGWNILVPEGEDVGGSFAETPACRDALQTQCVMSWSSFGANEPPSRGALFGYSPVPGMRPICTVPAADANGGWTKLDGYYFVKSTYPVKGGPITWTTDGPPPTAYAVADDFVEAQCVEDGPAGYLAIRIPRGTDDTRSRRIGGEVGMGGFFLPGWGKHLNDIAFAQEDLINLVAAMSDTVGRE